MRKWICALLCAAMMNCAAAALAGGREESAGYFKKPDPQAAPGVYTYGGSKRDWMHSMAVAPDGRIAIAGYTESSDGTLSDRTKTWRAGWVTMLDQRMNVLWNYCSRSGDADHMRFPVFQEDGTLTVIHETEGKQLKLITIDEHGERIKSRTLLSGARKDGMYAVEGSADAGYLIANTQDYGARVEYVLCDREGRTIWRTEEFAGISAVGGRHMIGRKKEETDFVLYRLPDTGGEDISALAAVYESDEDGSVSRGYSDLISLADGGAAACGSIWEGYSQGRVGETGLISRWDAQGRVVFEMHVTGNALKGIVKTQDGFAAMRLTHGTDGNDAWEMVRFSDQGIIGKTTLLGETPSRECALAETLPDGTVVCAQMTGGFGSEDVRLTLMDAQ